jgi:hypothetical protein
MLRCGHINNMAIRVAGKDAKNAESRSKSHSAQGHTVDFSYFIYIVRPGA